MFAYHKFPIFEMTIANLKTEYFLLFSMLQWLQIGRDEFIDLS